MRPSSPDLDYYGWLGVVLIIIGALGCLVGFGLFRSRSMQRRTQWYLTSILLQLANIVNSGQPLKYPALRFRVLCTTGGQFRLLDTMNLVILIAMLSGEALLIVGALLFFGVADSSISKETATFMGELLIPAVWILTAALAPKYFMDDETERMKLIHCEASQSEGLAIVRTKFGLPPDSNESDLPHIVAGAGAQGNARLSRATGRGLTARSTPTGRKRPAG